MTHLPQRPGRRPGLLVAAALAAIGALFLLAVRPAGAAPVELDRYGLLPMLPDVALDPAATDPDHPCYAEDQARRSAETKVRNKQTKYEQYKKWEGHSFSAAEVNAVFMELVQARIKLIDARYKLAICLTGLLNNGKGDKCKTLLLEHNSLEDQARQQEQIVAALKIEFNRLDKLRKADPRLASETQVSDAQDAVNAAQDVLNDLRKKRNAKLKELKANCKPAAAEVRGHSEIRAQANPDPTNPTATATSPTPTTPAPTTATPTPSYTYTPGNPTVSTTVSPSYSGAPARAGSESSTDPSTADPSTDPSASDDPDADLPPDEQDPETLDDINPDDVTEVVVYIDPPCDYLDIVPSLVCLPVTDDGDTTVPALYTATATF